MGCLAGLKCAFRCCWPVVYHCPPAGVQPRTSGANGCMPEKVVISDWACSIWLGLQIVRWPLKAGGYGQWVVFLLKAVMEASSAEQIAMCAACIACRAMSCHRVFNIACRTVKPVRSVGARCVAVYVSKTSPSVRRDQGCRPRGIVPDLLDSAKGLVRIKFGAL